MKYFVNEEDVGNLTGFEDAISFVVQWSVRSYLVDQDKKIMKNPQVSL